MRIRPLDRRDYRTLPSVFWSGTVVKRVEQRVKKTTVVLFRIERTPNITPVPDSKPELHLMLGNPDLYRGKGFILHDGNRWSEVGREPTASFNCHTYSLGERIGLTPEDWVEGEPTNLSLDTSPMEILLSVYFKLQKTLKCSEASSLISDPDLQAGDIVSFTYTRSHWGVCHLHSGQVKLVNGENWLASKFYIGRLVVTPIAEALSHYPQATAIRIYRFLGTQIT